MHEPCSPFELWAIVSLDHVRAAYHARENAPIRAAFGRPAHSGGDLESIGAVVVPIHGVIAPGWWGDVSPSEISAALTAAGRSSARTVILDINSPGGSVGGIPELSDQIHALRQRKQVIAVANPIMASAAFWLGSQAHEIVATRSSVVGSVGVIAGHVDISEAEKAAGIKTTIVTSTDAPFKGELDPSQPLSDAAREYIQSQIDELHGMFTNDISRGRGISASTVKANYGKGRTLFAAAALKAGMIDRVGSIQSVVDRLAREASARAERHVAAIKAEIGVGTDEPWSVRKTMTMQELFPPSLLGGDE